MAGVGDAAHVRLSWLLETTVAARFEGGWGGGGGVLFPVNSTMAALAAGTLMVKFPEDEGEMGEAVPFQLPSPPMEAPRSVTPDGAVTPPAVSCRAQTFPALHAPPGTRGTIACFARARGPF